MIDFGTARDLGRTAQGAAEGRQDRASTRKATPRPSRSSASPSRAATCSPWPARCITWLTGKSPEGVLHRRGDRSAAGRSGAPIAKEQRWFYELIKINLAEDVNDRYFTAREIKADLEKKQVTREVACPKCRTTNKVREAVLHASAPRRLTDATLACHHCGKTQPHGQPVLHLLWQPPAIITLALSRVRRAPSPARPAGPEQWTLDTLLCHPTFPVQPQHPPRPATCSRCWPASAAW